MNGIGKGAPIAILSETQPRPALVHLCELAAYDPRAEFCIIRMPAPVTRHASHDLIVHPAVQTEWHETVAAICEPLKIDLARMHEEIGAGFMEACIAAGEGLWSRPTSWPFGRLSCALALRQGRPVTFMPRWNAAAGSQSIHLHMSLKDKAGRSLFWGAGQRNGASHLFRWFLGGPQPPVGERTPIFLPTVNRYRRFAPGTFAPPGLPWGYENRTACFPLVGHDAGSLRVENRLPGADANPCLTTAATLAAGVAGIPERTEPDPEVIGSGYAQEATRDFARSRPEAIERLRASAFARDWPGDRFVDGFTAARAAQHDEFRRTVPDVELQRFFDPGCPDA